MADRSILFSAPMIRALLAGTKSQTRRIVKPQPATDDALWPDDDSHIEWSDIVDNTDYYVRCGHCPYGTVGSTLWVREAWAAWFQRGGVESDWKDTGKDWRSRELLTRLAYRATETTAAKRWVTPLFMPRWASRLSLKITGIRVERVQSISEEDAKAEGVAPAHMGYPEATYRRGFQAVWHEINGAPSWAANPWVWCVSFELVEVPRE